MTRRVLVTVALAACLASTAVACGRDNGSGRGVPTLTLVTHDSFAVSDTVLEDFEDQAGVNVRVLPAGDAGAALNQVVLTKDDPLGDVFFGVDNTFLSRAVDEDVFEEYESPALAEAGVPAGFQVDPTHALTPVDHGDVCVNYDRAYFAEHELAVPETLDDLTDPDYEGLLVVENPATSSPGLAFTLGTIATFGEDGWREYWSALRDNDVKVVDGWEQAYNGEFTGGEGGGRRPLVVSYATSPPATVLGVDPLPDEAPIGTILSSCFEQVEFAGILKGTGHEKAARQLVDFMLSEEFQEDIPLNMFVFPVRAGATLPEVFTRFAETPEQPLTLPAEQIGENRDRWIDEWTETVIR